MNSSSSSSSNTNNYSENLYTQLEGVAQQIDSFFADEQRTVDIFDLNAKPKKDSSGTANINGNDAKKAEVFFLRNWYISFANTQY